MSPNQTTGRSRWRPPAIASAMLACSLCACATSAPKATTPEPAAQRYEHAETQALVSLVNDAARLVETQGEGAFSTFRMPNSRWRQDETYIFVLDPSGDMLVHLDPAMEGKNQMGLKDVSGRPVILGLLNAATAASGKREGWYHYQWPVPGGPLARWKSSYVREVLAPSGKHYVVGSGMYNDRMERAFVVDVVTNAAAEISKRGRAAFPLLHDTTGPYLAKDAYVFVIDPVGRELVNPAFLNLEGRNVLDLKDTQGKPFVRAMLEAVQDRGSGWVDYMWPKPGESVSTQKSTYVTRAKVDGDWLLVGCGVYLADAPTSSAQAPHIDAPDLMQLVRDAAATFADRGARAFPEFRVKGSKWFSDDTYFFVWDMDGRRVFHAADPSIEGQLAGDEKDVVGRPYGKMFVDAAASPSGEGWVHYMYPEPGGIFPVWKSAFVKRVRFPSGRDHLVGAGVYRMQMNKAFIEDLVNRAAARIAARG